MLTPKGSANIGYGIGEAYPFYIKFYNQRLIRTIGSRGVYPGRVEPKYDKNGIIHIMNIIGSIIKNIPILLIYLLCQNIKKLDPTISVISAYKDKSQEKYLIYGYVNKPMLLELNFLKLYNQSIYISSA